MPRFSWGFNPEFREVGHATMSEAISLGRKILPQNDDWLHFFLRDALCMSKKHFQQKRSWISNREKRRCFFKRPQTQNCLFLLVSYSNCISLCKPFTAKKKTRETFCYYFLEVYHQKKIATLPTFVDVWQNNIKKIYQGWR